MVIYFARYDREKSVGMLSLYYYESIGKIDEYEGIKYLTIDDNILYKVLGKINKIINTGWFDDIKILIDTDDNLPDGITLENVVILIQIIQFIHNYFKKKH